jgi:hypothetical protein
MCAANGTRGVTCWGSVARTGPDTPVPIVVPAAEASGAPARLVAVGGYGACFWLAPSGARCACTDTGHFSFPCAPASAAAAQVAKGQDPFYAALTAAGEASVVGAGGAYAPPSGASAPGGAARHEASRPSLTYAG